MRNKLRVLNKLEKKYIKLYNFGVFVTSKSAQFDVPAKFPSNKMHIFPVWDALLNLFYSERHMTCLQLLTLRVSHL